MHMAGSYSTGALASSFNDPAPQSATSTTSRDATSSPTLHATSNLNYDTTGSEMSAALDMAFTPSHAAPSSVVGATLRAFPIPSGAGDAAASTAPANAMSATASETSSALRQPGSGETETVTETETDKNEEEDVDAESEAGSDVSSVDDPEGYASFDWYAQPLYYDLVFQSGTVEEVAFIESMLEQHGLASDDAELLEPACGTGKRGSEWWKRREKSHSRFCHACYCCRNAAVTRPLLSFTRFFKFFYMLFVLLS